MNIDHIVEHMKSCLPQEGVGLIVEKNGEEQWIPCTNVSDEEDQFLFDRKEYIEAQIKYDKIKWIVHSHTECEGMPEFSDHDKQVSDFIKIPFLVVGLPSEEYNVYNA